MTENIYDSVTNMTATILGIKSQVELLFSLLPEVT